MNHDDALRMSVSEKYLLNELSPELRAEFEEHFFDCHECAMDVSAGDAFIQQATQELRAPAWQPARKRNFLWSPALAWGAMAALALVIVYQNVVTFPRMKREVASVSEPAVMPSISLVGGISRGEQTPLAVITGKTPVLLSVDVPTEDRFANYALMLYTPSGELVWTISVSPAQARNTLPVQVPASNVREGTYTLLIRGISADATAPEDLVRHHFRLIAGN
jgi:Putative zinc-finger